MESQGSTVAAKLDFRALTDVLASEAACLGFEVAPFRLGWYNARVGDPRFRIGGAEDTLCYVVISTPSMFEKAFVPFLRNQLEPSTPSVGLREDDAEDEDEDEDETPAAYPPDMNHLDACMKLCFRRLMRTIPRRTAKVKSVHDFEMCPATRRPKVLVQTAGHVSGAVRFYQWADVSGPAVSGGIVLDDEFDCGGITGGKVFPVCVHPKYGGWFALRGVLIMEDLQVSCLIPREPPQILSGPQEIRKLLYLFNVHWRDGRYRDLGREPDADRYSDLQREYFGLATQDRADLIQRIISGSAEVDGENRSHSSSSERAIISSTAATSA